MCVCVWGGGGGGTNLAVIITNISVTIKRISNIM